MPMPDAFALPDTVAARADQDARFDAERGQIDVVLWDRTSPINGVPADHFLARPDVPAAGDVYLLQVNGHTFIFQPHHPEGGPIAPGHGADLGALHADQVVARRVHAHFLPALPPGTPATHDAATRAVLAAVDAPLPRTAPPHPQPAPPAPAAPAGGAPATGGRPAA